MSNSSLRKFITSCTMTFKAFDHAVTLSQVKSNLWHFTSVSGSSKKEYAIYCIPNYKQGKSLIKAALSQSKRKGYRLVIVTISLSEDDLIESDNLDFTLVSLKDLQNYGEEMLKARTRFVA